MILSLGAFWWFPFGGVPALESEELHRRLHAGEPIQLVDVRSHREFEAGHIAGAIHVPILHLQRRLPELLLQRDRTVVAICLTAHRSIPAVRLLRDAGFVDAVQLAGGMLRWRAAALPEVRSL